MNTKSLQETIRKVLKEELNESTYLRRRVDMSSLDKKFFTNLNIVTDKYLKRHDGYCSFNVFRTTVISYLIDDYHDNLSDDDYDNFPYDEVYNFLLNLFYDKIKDRYVEVFGGDINESSYLRRRVDMSSLDEEFYENLDIVTNRFLKLSSKKQYYSFNDFKNAILGYIIEDFHYELTNNRFDDYPYDEVYEFLSNHYHDEIKDRYVEVFGGDINESENIKKVLKEETNYTRMLLRRLPTDILNNIDNLFNSSLNYISKIFIKSYNSDPNKLSEREFIRRVIEDFLSITGARHYLPDQESDEYTQWSKTLTNELTNKYKDKIKSMYRVLKK